MRPVLVAGLSTGHKVGLLVVALAFIAFALISSFVAPRRNPNFPGERGAGVYYLITIAFFVVMIGAVEIFGAEGQEKTASAAELAKGGQARGTIQVTESEWTVKLPARTAQTLKAGSYTFHVVNNGKLPHNLTVNGPHVQNAHTPNISPGASADLKVTLESGQYDLYCSIPGHKQQGMDAKLAVG
jgi:uncharacterized cupredoxin-like copper-binding protein